MAHGEHPSSGKVLSLPSTGTRMNHGGEVSGPQQGSQTTAAMTDAAHTWWCPERLESEFSCQASPTFPIHRRPHVINGC
ncbi:rCG63691 [Rattus norvegicus]|uniref:RCG63691 n=1 Tax=Rattus norvegicus TaxID=10116 RepID=A6HQQ3_RAT|nr:rCG63691 [Rattus norvegicus]